MHIRVLTCFHAFVLLVLELNAIPLPRIYVHPLPNCSFDHFSEDEIDGKVWPFHPGRPPLLPIHHQISRGRYVTSDPTIATAFYIPAPFFLWDSSWVFTDQKLKCGQPLRRMRGTHRFDSSEHVFAFDFDAQPRTVMVWVKTSQPTSEFSTLLEMHLTAGRQAHILGILNGCPGISTCGTVHIAPCSTSINDGTWHHVAVTYENHTSSIYLDGQLSSKKRLRSSEGSADLKHFGNKNVCGYSHLLHGELRDLVFYGEALSQFQIRRCGLVEAPLNRSMYSSCFKSVRNSVEASPWFLRNRGWDHFVLFAGFDYPAAFNSISQPDEEDYIFEESWPSFANFTVLHFGSRSERCFSHDRENKAPKRFAIRKTACWRRFLRTITIPPILTNEPIQYAIMRDASQSRPTRIAYRGLAYGPMVERAAMRNAATNSDMMLLQLSKQIRLEFSNWTYELVDGGSCSKHSAFEGLCSWKNVGNPLDSTFGKSRATSMKKRALELWASSDTCLVLPGDGGYELRLFSMMNLGCIPVIVNAHGLSHPKLPFVSALPWHEFAIFWTLNATTEKDLTMTAHQLLQQLVHLDRNALMAKRKALFQHVHRLNWNQQDGGGDNETALDYLVLELDLRSRMPVDPRETTRSMYGWKTPGASMRLSFAEDITGNSCPSGFPICELHAGDPHHGDCCKGLIHELDFRCPAGCKYIGYTPPYCSREVDGKEVACRSEMCSNPVQQLEKGWGPNGFHQVPKLAIISSSSDTALSALTRSSLDQFIHAHGDRYDLLVYDELLLDPRDWAPSWNKLAILKRALIMYNFDAVIWVDAAVLFTQPQSDPMHSAVKSMFSLRNDRLGFASLDASNDGRVSFDTGILGLKIGRQTMKMIDVLFRIGRRRYLLDGMWRIPRKESLEDAFAVYIQEHGLGSFEPLPHGTLQSVFSASTSFWLPGSFATHFAVSNPEMRLQLISDFVSRNAAQLDHSRS